jgi:ABC-type uncharacterized transport system permease subunit
MDRLSVLCFAGTYALAVVSDQVRLTVRDAGRWSLTVGLTGLGWAVHTAYLAHWALHFGGLPSMTVRDSLLVLAWILAALDLYLILRSPRPLAIGLFVLPVVIALAAASSLFGHRLGWASWGGPVRFWIGVHVTLQLLGAFAACVAFVSGLMYLAQARRLKAKTGSRTGLPLPSLEQSERLNRWSIMLAFPLMSIGLALGLALIAATRRAGLQALSWTDPKVLSGAALWAVFAILVHARLRPAMRGRRVALLTIVAFGFLLFLWIGVGLLLPTDHGMPPGLRGTP